MSNKSDACSTYIRDLSYNKLSHYYHSSKDTSIRKFVLITNVLRQTTSHLGNNNYDHSEDLMEIDQHFNESQDDQLEQQWLDSCLDELEREEQTWLPPPVMTTEEKPQSCHYVTQDSQDNNTMVEQDRLAAQQQSTKLYFHAGVVACFNSIEYSLK